MMRTVRLVTAAPCLFLALILGGCDWGPLNARPEGDLYVMVTTSDYTSGNVSLIAMREDTFAVATDLLSIHSDNLVVAHGASAYILERLGADNIIRIDNALVSSDNLVYQQSVGTAVNIADLGIINSTKAYAVLYGSPSISIINPSTGAQTGSISFGSYVHAGETFPFMQDIIIVGEKAYVLCQRLKTFQGQSGPYPGLGDSTGLIVVVSTVTDAVVSTIRLALSNPAEMDTAGGFLFVAATGSWMTTTDGGVEKISLATDASAGTVITGADVGGYITGIEMVSATKGYVQVGKYDASFNYATQVVEFDPTAGAARGAVDGIANGFGGLAYDGRYLYVGERSTTSAGVIVVNPADNSIVAGPIDVGALPPNDLAVVRL